MQADTVFYSTAMRTQHAAPDGATFTLACLGHPSGPTRLPTALQLASLSHACVSTGAPLVTLVIPYRTTIGSGTLTATVNRASFAFALQEEVDGYEEDDTFFASPQLLECVPTTAPRTIPCAFSFEREGLAMSPVMGSGDSDRVDRPKSLH